MEKEFAGKVAAATGAGIGIGYEICRSLVERGSLVVLNDLDASVATEAASKIDSECRSTIAISVDASDPQFIDSLFETALDRFGHINVAIANAGITTYGFLLDHTVEKFGKLVALNLQGSFFLAQGAKKSMRKQDTGRKILFMSLATGHQSHPSLVPYGMTKAALRMLAKGSVGELSQYGINVNAISPGVVLTERTMGDDPNFEESWGQATPLGKPATVKDVANAALFLISEKARRITGQTLLVDGGWASKSYVPDLQIPD